MTIYAVYLWQEDGHGYAVTAPDFPGFATSAKTMDEVVWNAIKGLVFHMQSMIKVKEDIPEPSSLNDALKTLEEDPYSDAATVIMVDIPEAAEKAVRCNVTLPESLVKLIDAEANLRNTTRSGFLKEAALRELEIDAGQDAAR
ncbi:MAG: ribbon-helix-helix protein, CopG family [Rhodospirillaceae bacterium]|jgi:predicted RNase H-like HicB family nuclease|nr:ribbon-helix-helix protein, CopG family [Rhodospirillaceae bacterium]MBT4671736.1 ribbon-helix-helix protein, CopG family [Rhodospirillaceae bacterium]MBT4719022.1 ribbon-helix-helix protein, CopG family [Rhodospirillaceae bacterium]MBT4751560.1 ribbon-helix-helix protein, CopG family [Rhodospirillaceae bacterium]MBT5179375.1 ribbon-helix-helix protein, CopG family [Rhodospirillaceae bacterium]